MLPAVITRSASRALPRPLLRAEAIAFVSAIAVGVLIRLRPVLASDFPLNDGGMFATVIRDIERDIYPATLSYNGLALPFAYPPLAFYLGALAEGAGVALTDVLRWLPFTFAALSVVLFARLARALLRDEIVVAIATFAFSVTPAAFTWLVMGGGLTRGLGLCLALAALERIATYLDTRSRPALATASFLAGLTLLAHLEMAWFLGLSAVVIWAWRRRDRATLGGLAIAGLGALAVAAPWLVTVIARHGIAPLAAAAGTGSLDNPLTDFVVFTQTGEPWFPIVAALAVLGAVQTIASRRPALAAWVAIIAFADSRSFGTLSAIPMAMLAALAVRELVTPLITSPRVRVGLGAVAATYALVAVTHASPSLLVSVPSADRAAMAWARDATPRDAAFLVVTERGWAENASGEWFPALAARRSVSTVQGYEWLPDRAFWRQLRLFFAAQSCGSRDAACLDALRIDALVRFDYVYLPAQTLATRADGTDAPCCAGLRAALQADPRYERVYAQDGALIFRVR